MKPPRPSNPTQDRRLFFGVIAALLLLSWGAASLAAPKAGGGRTAQQIAADIQKVGQDVAPLFASPQELFDPAKRQAAAPKAIPALRKMISLLDELIATRPAGASQGQEKTQLVALLAALGDKDAAAKLGTMASSNVAGEAAAGRAGQIFANWLLTDGQPAAQEKVVADLAALANKFPNETTVSAAAIMLAGTTRPEAVELRQRIGTIVTGSLKGHPAELAARQIETISAKFEAQQKLKALEGKPFAVQGATPAGSVFSSGDSKGKVVLVDFWASWCGPCKAELPKLKKLYAQYHAQGLEVVGVSCDNSGDELVKFLSQNKDMPWPQLFDASTPGWHPLATQYGVNSIPTMFLVDRKGVLRSVEARATYETLVPKLLAEPQ